MSLNETHSKVHTGKHLSECFDIQNGLKQGYALSLLLFNFALEYAIRNRLRVFENKGLWRIFGPTRDEVTGGWRKLHNEELHDLYSLPSIIRIFKSRRMRWAGHVARMGEKRNAYRLLVVMPEGKRPLGRPSRRWVDNINTDLLERGWGGVDWTGLAQRSCE
jgi:hypothetical protein